MVELICWMRHRIVQTSGSWVRQQRRVGKGDGEKPTSEVFASLAYS